MGMFCYQCQEAAKGTGCTIKGVCGKTDDLANLMDLLLHLLKGISVYSVELREKVGYESPTVNKFIFDGLFATITNANFDKDVFYKRVEKALEIREMLKMKPKRQASRLIHLSTVQLGSENLRILKPRLLKWAFLPKKTKIFVLLRS